MFRAENLSVSMPKHRQAAPTLWVKPAERQVRSTHVAVPPRRMRTDDHERMGEGQRRFRWGNSRHGCPRRRQRSVAHPTWVTRGRSAAAHTHAGVAGCGARGDHHPHRGAQNGCTAATDHKVGAGKRENIGSDYIILRRKFGASTLAG